MQRTNPEQYKGAATDNVLDGADEQTTQLNPDAAYVGAPLDKAPGTADGINGLPVAIVIEVIVFDNNTDAQLPKI